MAPLELVLFTQQQVKTKLQSIQYTNTHLRRKLVMFVLKDVEFFLPLLKLSITGNYVHVRLSAEEIATKEKDGTLSPQEAADYRMPDPFSLFSYLEYLLTHNKWGEEIVLTLVSMMWQIRITVVYTESLLQKWVRHNKSLESTALVVAYCGGTHYVGVGKHSFCLQRCFFLPQR